MIDKEKKKEYNKRYREKLKEKDTKSSVQTSEKQYIKDDISENSEIFFLKQEIEKMKQQMKSGTLAPVVNTLKDKILEQITMIAIPVALKISYSIYQKMSVKPLPVERSQESTVQQQQEFTNVLNF